MRFRCTGEGEGRALVMDSTIERKLSAGFLPTHHPVKSWAGFGTGASCDGCDQPILATEVEHELDFAESATRRFHATCEAIWRALVDGAGPAVAGGV
jgi:hypothetical protein